MRIICIYGVLCMFAPLMLKVSSCLFFWVLSTVHKIPVDLCTDPQLALVLHQAV